jgi:hypothetical protein
MNTLESDTYHDISERVGWRKRDVRWPTYAEVQAAQFDAVRLLTWSRFLPRAENREQQAVIASVVRYLAPAIRSVRATSISGTWAPDMWASGS